MAHSFFKQYFVFPMMATAVETVRREGGAVSAGLLKKPFPGQPISGTRFFVVFALLFKHAVTKSVHLEPERSKLPNWYSVVGSAAERNPFGYSIVIGTSRSALTDIASWTDGPALQCFLLSLGHKRAKQRLLL